VHGHSGAFSEWLQGHQQHRLHHHHQQQQQQQQRYRRNHEPRRHQKRGQRWQAEELCDAGGGGWQEDGEGTRQEEEEEAHGVQGAMDPSPADAIIEQCEIAEQLAANTRRMSAIMQVHLVAMYVIMTDVQRALLGGLTFTIPPNVRKCVESVAQMLKFEPEALPPAADARIGGEVAHWIGAGLAPPRRWVIGSGAVSCSSAGGSAEGAGGRSNGDNKGGGAAMTGGGSGGGGTASTTRA
jgi:hypothetical protein